MEGFRPRRAKYNVADVYVHSLFLPSRAANRLKHKNETNRIGQRHADHLFVAGRNCSSFRERVALQEEGSSRALRASVSYAPSSLPKRGERSRSQSHFFDPHAEGGVHAVEGATQHSESRTTHHSAVQSCYGTIILFS